MSDFTTDISALPADDAWLQDWVAEGIAAIEQYLAKHARFSELLAAWGLLDDGDGGGKH